MDFCNSTVFLESVSPLKFVWNAFRALRILIIMFRHLYWPFLLARMVLVPRDYLSILDKKYNYNL